MPMTDAGANVALEEFRSGAVPLTHYALHTGYPGATGASNEATGGSPAYARKAGTMSAAASRAMNLSTASLLFDLPASTVYWWSAWTAITAGSCYAFGPLSGGAKFGFVTDDAATDVLDSPAHGFTAGQKVVLWQTLGAALPTGLSVGTVYTVRTTGLTTDALTLATDAGGAGGSAIDLTTIGRGLIQRMVYETGAAQWQYNLTDIDLSIPL